MPDRRDEVPLSEPDGGEAREEPTYELPRRREVVDLQGVPMLPPLPRARNGEVPAEPNLELDRPPEPAPLPPPPRRIPRWPLALAVLAIVAFAGIRAWQARPPTRHDSIIELVGIPPGARLTLDGAPIVGQRLQLTRSSDEHSVVVLLRGTPRTIRFSADHDITVDVSK